MSVSAAPKLLGYIPADPRFPTLLSIAAFSTLLSPLLFIIPGAIATNTHQLAGVAVFFAFALPFCALPGLARRSPSLLAGFCCGSALLGLLFIIGAATIAGAGIPRLQCVCDAACMALPARGGGAGGGGGGGGFGRGAPPQTPEQQLSELWSLRNSTVYVDLCSREPSVVSAWGSYAVLGAIALALQCAACGAACRLRSSWTADAKAGIGGGGGTPFVPPHTTTPVQVFVYAGAPTVSPIAPLFPPGLGGGAPRVWGAESGAAGNGVCK